MDATLIEQVINNLLENAYFHSGSHGPIDLQASVDGPYVSIAIRDQGNGIRPELLGTLFDGGGLRQPDRRQPQRDGNRPYAL